MSKRSTLFGVKTKSRCSQPPCNFSATHFNCSVSNQLITEFFRDVVMISLKRASVHLVAISKLDEFLHGFVADEVTPTATVKPPARLIDQNHEQNVTLLPTRGRGPPYGPVQQLNVPRLRRRPLRMPLE